MKPRIRRHLEWPEGGSPPYPAWVFAGAGRIMEEGGRGVGGGGPVQPGQRPVAWEGEAGLW